MSIEERIPADWPVQPNPTAPGHRYTTCGTCGLTWDNDQVTGITPAPSGRCPFEPFHDDPEDEDDGPDFLTNHIQVISVVLPPSILTDEDVEAIEEAHQEGLVAGDEDPRTFAILALHADIVREDAQWSGYDEESAGASTRERIVRLEGLVERLAGQVSELALRLAQS